eukprot:3024852-Amphidinium_carterae.1
MVDDYAGSSCQDKESDPFATVQMSQAAALMQEEILDPSPLQASSFRETDIVLEQLKVEVRMTSLCGPQ